MGTTLTGTQIQNTYDSLIKVSDNTTIGSSSKQLSDGLGNDLPIRFTTSSTTFTSSVDFTSATVTGLGGVAITNNVNDRVLTATGTQDINGETYLTFNTTAGLNNRYDYNSEGDIRIDGSITPSGSIIQRETNAATDWSGVIQDWGAFPAAPTVGLVYYWNGTFWVTATNTSEAGASGIIMIATDTTAVPRMLSQGMMQASIYGGLSTGDKLYIGTSGALTNVAPTTTGTFVRHVGWCVDSGNRKIYFNPDNSYFENT
jgi:hypothetical protein